MVRIKKLSEDKFMYLIPSDRPTGVFMAMDNFVGEDGELYYARNFYRGVAEVSEGLAHHVHICKTGLLMSVSDYVIHKDSGEIKQLTAEDLTQFEAKPILRDSYLRVVSTTDNLLVWEKEEELDNRLGMYYKILDESELGSIGELVRYVDASYEDGVESVTFKTSRGEFKGLPTSIERLIKTHKLRALLRMSYPTEDLDLLFGSGLGVKM